MSDRVLASLGNTLTLHILAQANLEKFFKAVLRKSLDKLGITVGALLLALVWLNHSLPLPRQTTERVDLGLGRFGVHIRSFSLLASSHPPLDLIRCFNPRDERAATAHLATAGG